MGATDLARGHLLSSAQLAAAPHLGSPSVVQQNHAIALTPCSLDWCPICVPDWCGPCFAVATAQSGELLCGACPTPLSRVPSCLDHTVVGTRVTVNTAEVSHDRSQPFCALAEKDRHLALSRGVKRVESATVEENHTRGETAGRAFLNILLRSLQCPTTVSRVLLTAPSGGIDYACTISGVSGSSSVGQTAVCQAAVTAPGCF